jgi:hypothetical protein
MSTPQKSFSESGSSPPVFAKITKVDIIPGSSVGIGYAVDAEGVAFTFAGDWRPLLAIAEALYEGHDVNVWLDGWTIISYETSR